MVFKWTFLSTFLNDNMEVLAIAKQNEVQINEQITFPNVMVIGPNGEKLGIKSKEDALTLANYAGFDLVLISPNANPQVCKIMDYNKYKYESKKKAKENLKKQRETNLEMKVILNVIKNEGYIEDVEFVEDGKQGEIKVTLKK